jgi:hypothetical protein
MLQGTTSLPSKVLGKCPPSFNDATVELVAANAVMAGCAPSHFPIVLAAVEALLDEAFNAHGVNATTMGATPCVIVNGPLPESTKMNFGVGALGSGTRANASIGRSLKLVMQNIGGAVCGGSESTTVGTPMKFTMCIREDEDKCKSEGWSPLHVTRGFKADETVVTVSD